MPCTIWVAVPMHGSAWPLPGYMLLAYNLIHCHLVVAKQCNACCWLYVTDFLQNNQRSNYPAILRSEFVSHPLGVELESKMMAYLMSCDHSTWNMMDGHAQILPKTISPTMWQEASFTPIISGQSWMTSWQSVDAMVDSFRMVWQSWIACVKGQFWCR